MLAHAPKVETILLTAGPNPRQPTPHEQLGVRTVISEREKEIAHERAKERSNMRSTALRLAVVSSRAFICISSASAARDSAISSRMMLDSVDRNGCCKAQSLPLERT
jgi:hypothetical protein